jgi:2-keto-3-deoxy-L-rhamnonate aldolase RhmA
MSNAFLDRLRAGELTLMLGIRSARTHEVVRLAATTGHHSVMIDLEHSAMPLDVAVMLCSTAQDLGLAPFVRIPEYSFGVIGPLLDGGAQGIIAPRVDTAEDAALVASASRFALRGHRSQLAMVPQLAMRPTPATTLNPILDDATIVQIMIETPTGVANADSIAAIDGVDMIAIGANDLTAEMGIPGQYEHALVHDAVAAVAQACARHGKLLMIGGISDLDVLGSFDSLGVCPLRLTGTDTDLLYAGASARASAFVERTSR